MQSVSPPLELEFDADGSLMLCAGELCRWISSNDTCPICRASLTERPLPPAPASCLPPQQQQQAGAARGGVQQMADHRIEEELLFRLGSVQR